MAMETEAIQPLAEGIVDEEVQNPNLRPSSVTFGSVISLLGVHKPHVK